MRGSRIGTPIIDNNNGEKAAKSLENRSNEAAKADADRNWRSRRQDRFKDIGFDEGEIPVNPFQNVKDVSELPMKGGTENRKPASEFMPENHPEKETGDGPAYTYRAPVQQEGKAKEVVARILDKEILVKPRDILATSKHIREELKFQISPQRVNAGEQVKPSSFKSQLIGTLLNDKAIDIDCLPLPKWEKKTEKTNNGEQVSAYVVGDVVLQYLESLAPNETPKQVVIAQDSQGLRCLYPLVNGRLHIESLGDSGSQIVSISQAKAEKAGLVWDPDIVIYMQSANKGLEKSLGLARNVPFLFGDMTVLLQVHVIREPAYDLLLGRPFDTLLQTQIQNFPDGRQTIIITDPVSKRKLAIPTFERGAATLVQKPPKIEKQIEKGFLITSMI
jgi:hypothetical protein